MTITARCGECRETIVSQTGQGLLDGIRLHCREYHPTFGNGGEVFDRVNPRLKDLMGD